MRLKREETAINLLDLIPGRRCKWEMEGDTVIVLYPKFRNRFLARTLLPRMSKPNWKIRLDDIGSFVWLHCDGKATVGEIAESMKNHFGEKAEPVIGRLSLFLQKLAADKFIYYENFPSKTSEH